MGFILADTNRQVQEFIDKVLSEFDAMDLTGSLQETKERLRSSLEAREKVKLVLVGQYSAGKSSLLKMLTGNDEIRIAPGITTDKATTYLWGSVEIVDTPGIDTQLRPEHDEISQQAIRDADMLIFVITNELFDNLIAKDFREIAFEKKKADSIILVVNKMGRARLGNSKEQQDIIVEGLTDVTEPKRPEDFYVSFVDAKDYLDAQGENDASCAKELLQESGYELFSETLNRFITEKGVMAKLLRPLHECREILDEVAKSNANIASDDQEAFEEQRNELRAAKEDFDSHIQQYATQAASEIREVGNELMQDIYYGADRSRLEFKAKSTSEEIGQIMENYIGRITEEIAFLEQRTDIHVEDELGILCEEKKISVASVGNGKNREELLNASNKAVGQLGQWGAKLAAKTNMQIAEGLGYTNAISRWWHSGEIAKAANLQRVGGQVLQGGAVAVGIVIQYYNEKQRDEEEKKLSEARAEVASQIESVVNNLERGMNKCMEELGKLVERKIDMWNNKTASAQMKEQKRLETFDTIESYKENINQLLDGLRGRCVQDER